MTRKELIEQIKSKKSFLCVGLDPDLSKMPAHLLGKEDSIFVFNKAIIDATAPYSIAYKPNLAFYEAYGVEGYISFEKTVKYIKERYPEIFVIADAKRGDIGNTSKMYAKSFFEHLDVDAVTVAPYMGSDSVTPFLGYDGKWVVLLALTSNKGSLDFQMTQDKDGELLFEKVIKTARTWASDDELMFVAGATRGQMLGDVRKLAPRNFLLVPGVGAQGGSLEEVAKFAMTDECGLIVNSSRGIIFASKDEDFAEAAAREAAKLAESMAALLKDKGII